MSPSGLPILKHQLGTFFAVENEKECGEGVTQCQQYIGDFFPIFVKVRLLKYFPLIGFQ